MATQDLLYVLDFKSGHPEDDSPKRLGRVAVGLATGGELKTIIDHEHLPDGIDIFDGRMYWTQMGTVGQNDGQVQSAALNGTDVKNIYTPGEIHTPKQIVIERSTRKVYVCDREGMRVHRSDLDGSNKEVLIRTGDWRQGFDDHNLHCVGIAVDTKQGKFYWTQKGPSKGGSGRIFRASIDIPAGKNADDRDDIELLYERLPEPIDLEINSTTQTLYWTDRGEEPKGNTLNKADVSGAANPGASQKYDIIVKGLHEAIGLQVDEKHGHIYTSELGSDSKGGSIYRFDSDGGNKLEMYEGQGAYTGIALASLPVEQAKSLYGL